MTDIRETDMNFENNLITSFESPLNNDIRFGLMLKVFPVKGNIVYEYNPFHNFRVEKNSFEYKKFIYTEEELFEKYGIKPNGDYTGWNGLTDDDIPILIEAGSIVDFDTEQLQFDVNHPIEMLPQYSYDGSTNLVINDGKNIPRLINSRFSVIGKNQYEVVDRKGDNDVNIYDQGKQFDIDTSLYKRVVEIPELDFLGVFNGGNLPVGNYVFYFKYMDDDGNETDFVSESGIVSLFIGYGPDSENGGIKDMNSFKSVKFLLSNIDPGYSFVKVCLTRTTSAESGEIVTSAYEINEKFEVSKSMACQINVLNLDNALQITLEDINRQYFIASSAETQTSVQNRLFLGNVHKPDIPYKELSDLSLRICPSISKKSYNIQDYEYSNDVKNTYNDESFIYNYTGYANGEMYCFGIVYIMPDNTLSPVFYIRGAMNISEQNNYSKIPIYKTTDSGLKERVYISYDEESGEIISPNDDGYEIQVSENIENVWGVVSILVKQNGSQNDSNTIYSIDFNIDKDIYSDFFKILSDNNIKGFFFVRQKRIPITLCQALSIATDKYSYVPVLPVDSTYLKNFINNNEINNSKDGICYIAETFLDEDRKLTHDFIGRIRVLNINSINQNAAICPDYDCNQGRFNSIFNGTEFYINEANFKPVGDRLSMDASQSRHMYVNVETNNNFNNDSYQKAPIITVNDSAPIIAIKESLWRGRAGEAEEAYRFEYLQRENKVKNATNIIRGVFGPYLGLGTPITNGCSILNIKTSECVSSDYNKIKARHSDKSPYYSISKRYSLKLFYKNETELNDYNIISESIKNIYRGDSFICMFTHRFNRNFQDPDTPINDKIVDEETWINGYQFDDNDFANINRGDVNAIQMGMWVTFPVISYRNLNIRSLDNNYPEEEALTGNKRGFYPYYGLHPGGAFKMPESSILNIGLSQSLGERWNFPVPDVPYIKNHFQNRILYSDVHVNDAFKNGFRVFQAMSYKDYPMTYGSITKLMNLNGNIICVFEHGIVSIPVNERVQSGEGAGGNVFINTPNVLPENPFVISDMFGSQWKDSIIKTPAGIYGVDTIAKKIWRIDGNKIEIISDFKIQQFLNLNISLTERELLPIIGIRNVKTHFNRFKNDVMFTFYDNTVGFEEKVWNVCFNEILNTWVTFYSWLPSYSENIDNMYFSFDRNTSKWITKLGMSKAGNSFSEGIVLTENIFKKSIFNGNRKIGDLDCIVELPDSKTGIRYIKKFSLQHDNFGYYKKYFEIKNNSLYVKNGVNYDDLIANIYTIDKNTGRRIFKNRNESDYRDTIVFQLNVRCDITLEYDGDNNNIKQHVSEWNEYQYLGMGYYEYVVAVMPEDNMMFLTTDFWKHGQSGIIDIKDEIKPCVWYGKQHPFEFEFVVVDDTSIHKIFECLEIIGNNSEPDSFHYEVVGDAYEFSVDKKNMYFRQEALKALYQYNGSDILYEHSFTDVIPEQRNVGTYNEKSTVFPLYYARQDTFNDVEDYYRLLTAPNKDYINLTGSEIIYDKVMCEYHIWTHKKASDIKKNGLFRGDMSYDEDKWYVQIPLINCMYKNEDNWRVPESEPKKTYIDSNGKSVTMALPPLGVMNSPVPGDIINTDLTDDDFPECLKDLGYNIDDIDLSEWVSSHITNSTKREEANIRDKWCKIRVRYTGEKMTIVQAVKTLYNATTI